MENTFDVKKPVDSSIVHTSGSEANVVLDRKKGIATKVFKEGTAARYPTRTHYLDGLRMDIARANGAVSRLAFTQGKETLDLNQANLRSDMGIASEIDRETNLLLDAIKGDIFGAISIAKEVGIRRYLARNHPDVASVLVTLREVRASWASERIKSKIAGLKATASDKEFIEGMKLLYKTNTVGAEIDIDIAEADIDFMTLAQKEPIKAELILKRWSSFLAATAELGLINLDKPHIKITRYDEYPPVVKTYDYGACKAIDKTGQEKSMNFLFPGYTQNMNQMDGICGILDSNLTIAQTAALEWRRVKEKAYDTLLPLINLDDPAILLDPFSNALAMPNIAKIVKDNKTEGNNADMDYIAVQLAAIDRRLLVPLLTLTRDVVCNKNVDVRGLVGRFKELCDDVSIDGKIERFDPQTDSLWQEIVESIEASENRLGDLVTDRKIEETQELAAVRDEIKSMVGSEIVQADQNLHRDEKDDLAQTVKIKKVQDDLNLTNKPITGEEHLKDENIQEAEANPLGTLINEPEFTKSTSGEATVVMPIEQLILSDDEPIVDGSGKTILKREKRLLKYVALQVAKLGDAEAQAKRPNLQRFYNITQRRGAMIKTGDDRSEAFQDLTSKSLDLELDLI